MQPSAGILSILASRLSHIMREPRQRLIFDALMSFNRSGIGWPGRLKHPAADPMNALLSLAYTMLMQEMTALADAHGLDPALEPAALRRFFEKYENWMLSGKIPFRRLLQREVERLVGVLRKKEPWIPFRWPEPESEASGLGWLFMTSRTTRAGCVWRTFC